MFSLATGCGPSCSGQAGRAANYGDEKPMIIRRETKQRQMVFTGSTGKRQTTQQLTRYLKMCISWIRKSAMEQYIDYWLDP